MTNTSPVATLHNVGKQYGKRWALRNVNLTLSPGEIVGFIGPNGAGKTTLMRLMAGLSPATEGQLTVLGEKLNGNELHTPIGIGLMLEQMGFIAHLSGKANLEMLAGLQRVATSETITQTLTKVGLDPADRRPVRAYSLGMRQRLCLAQALMEKPKLLLLDEPTNGLDPAGIVDLRKLLTDVAHEGTAIFVASHLLTEVERLCHRVLLVKAGEILKELDLRSPGPLRVRVVVSSEKDADLLAKGDVSAERQTSESGAPTFLVTPNGSIPELIRQLVALGIDIEEISAAHQSLEKEFLTLFR
jgi:ABC-2 type transport system ATP-binding protein